MANDFLGANPMMNRRMLILLALVLPLTAQAPAKHIIPVITHAYRICTVFKKTETTAADASVLTCPIPAQAGNYRLRFVMSISAANAATLGWTARWTDGRGNVQAPINLGLIQAGNATPVLAFTVAALAGGDYYGYADIDVNNSSRSIVVKLTFTGTSFTAKVSATVERIWSDD